MEAQQATAILLEPLLCKGDTACPGVPLVRRWLVDTGSAHDIARDSAIRNCPQWKTEMREPLALSTANGVMHAREVCNLSVPSLAIDIEAVILPSTPCLLSVGRRCMEEGFTFVWKAKRPPYFITRRANASSVRCTIVAHI